jgi:PmbA protein
MENLSCKFESGRLKTVGLRESITISVDVLVGARKGSATGNNPEAIGELVDRALSLAAAGSAAHFEAYPAPGAITPVTLHSPVTAAVTREQLIEGGQAIVDALKDYDREMDINAGASRHEAESLLVTSGGINHTQQSTAWSLSGQAQRTRGTDMLFAGYGRGWGEFNEWFDPTLIQNHVLEDLRLGETLVEMPSGALPMVIPHEYASMFLWPLLMGVNGRNVAKGDSPLRGRLGEKVLHNALTLRDNPHRAFAHGSAIDHDGVPTQPTTIFEEGVLKCFLYDLDSAGLAGVEPTGHNGCSPYNPVLAPGTESSEALLAGIGEGILVKQLLGFGQSNIMNGDFSANVGLGYRVRDGKIVGRVKDVMVAGNLYELFAAPVQISSDVDPITLMPSLILNGVSVSSAE